MDSLLATVAALEPDIVAITESWANEAVSDSELHIQGYDMFRQDRPCEARGGGVLLYVASILGATEYQTKASFPEHV